MKLLNSWKSILVGVLCGILTACGNAPDPSIDDSALTVEATEEVITAPLTYAELLEAEGIEPNSNPPYLDPKGIARLEALNEEARQEELANKDKLLPLYRNVVINYFDENYVGYGKTGFLYWGEIVSCPVSYKANESKACFQLSVRPNKVYGHYSPISKFALNALLEMLRFTGRIYVPDEKVDSESSLIGIKSADIYEQFITGGGKVPVALSILEVTGAEVGEVSLEAPFPCFRRVSVNMSVRALNDIGREYLSKGGVVSTEIPGRYCIYKGRHDPAFPPYKIRNLRTSGKL